MSQWDDLSAYFNTHSKIQEINPDVADNILIAWPSLLRGIQAIQSSGVGLSALDYGCGCGGFCKELSNREYLVNGCDVSSAMVLAAQKCLPDIKFYHCDSVYASSLPGAPFSLITSIMVLQFINNIQQLFTNLDKSLKSGGIIAIAVFNPDYITQNHGAGKCFIGFENPAKPTTGFLCFDGNTQIPVFIRTVEEYDAQLIPLGYKRVYLDRPAFTSQYLSLYKTTSNITSPEFLVMIYQKHSQ